MTPLTSRNSQRLNLKYENPLSNVAFNFNMRPCAEDVAGAQLARAHLLLERRAAYALELESRVKEETARATVRPGIMTSFGICYHIHAPLYGHSHTVSSTMWSFGHFYVPHYGPFTPDYMDDTGGLCGTAAEAEARGVSTKTAEWAHAAAVADSRAAAADSARLKMQEMLREAGTDFTSFNRPPLYIRSIDPSFFILSCFIPEITPETTPQKVLELSCFVPDLKPLKMCSS